MTFKVGNRYRDATGRKWRIIKWVAVSSYRVYLVRRFLRTEIAVMESNDTLNVLVDYGFTTLYADGGVE